MKVPQELVVVLFLGGVIGFFLFVIISSRRKKDKDTDKGNSSNSKWFIKEGGESMDRDTIIFYSIFFTVAGIFGIVRFIGWRKEKRQEKEKENKK